MANKLPSHLQAKLDAQCIHYLYANAPKAVPTNFIISGILVIVFWSQVDWFILLLWWLSLVLLTLGRLIHSRSVLSNGTIELDRHKAQLQFGIGAVLTGVIWGMGYAILAAPTEQIYREPLLIDEFPVVMNRIRND